MTPSHPIAHSNARRSGEVFLFGIPIGQLGWFATLLMGTAAGFAAFFAGTFLGIVGLIIANATTHGSLDYAMAYRRIGFPLGLLVLVASLGFLISLRIRRGMRKEDR
jgi:hypothetical protein